MTPERLKTFIALHNEVARRFFSQTKVAKVISNKAEQVADNLIARNVISPEEKVATVNILKDHSKALAFIDRISERLRPYPLGTPSGAAKTASYSGQYPLPERESDRVFKEILLRKVRS
ncbi:MAG: hypothetical protein KatS3mg087_0124 [Patescibacteria group bacterium]|nr:MAG: hypothetical protein KatS3mg087_0124 [Patescibacteria group bacterium]